MGLCHKGSLQGQLPLDRELLDLFGPLSSDRDGCSFGHESILKLLLELLHLLLLLFVFNHGLRAGTQDLDVDLDPLARLPRHDADSLLARTHHHLQLAGEVLLLILEEELVELLLHLLFLFEVEPVSLPDDDRAQEAEVFEF